MIATKEPVGSGAREGREPVDEREDHMSGADSRSTFDACYGLYQPELFRYAFRLTQQQADADDLLQESMLKAFGAFDRLESHAEVRAWFYRIVTNTFLSQKRKAAREQALDDGMLATMRAPEPDLAGAIDARQTLDEVRRFVDGLPEKQRAALMLRKYHEFGYAEIASMLDSSEDAARANVYEAVRKLRGQFGDRI